MNQATHHSASTFPQDLARCRAPARRERLQPVSFPEVPGDSSTHAVLLPDHKTRDVKVWKAGNQPIGLSEISPV
jgi:hypothetical protein